MWHVSMWRDQHWKASIWWMRWINPVWINLYHDHAYSSRHSAFKQISAVCPMHEAIMCLMLPLCVRCGRCVSDVATVCSMLVRCSI